MVPHTTYWYERVAFKLQATGTLLLLNFRASPAVAPWLAENVVLQERKRGLVIAERQEKEMQRVVENEQRMAELHKKIHRVEEVRFPCLRLRSRS